MNAAEILDSLDESRERLLVALESLPDEAFYAPGAVGDWTLADLLVHLTAWESEMVTGLMHINQGKRPDKLLAAFDDVDGYNLRTFQANQGRELDRIFDDLQRVRLHLEQWLEEFSDRDLTDPQRFPWSKGFSLAHLIKENSFGHEQEHLPEIDAFVARWQAQHPPQA
jgi:uncharacterized damage-inducible protein DinB